MGLARREKIPHKKLKKKLHLWPRILLAGALTLALVCQRFWNTNPRDMGKMMVVRMPRARRMKRKAGTLAVLKNLL